jgi:hypothetical protein
MCDTQVGKKEKFNDGNSRNITKFSPSKIKVYPGSTLVLRLLLHSQIAETLLFRPTLDDWLVDNCQILYLSSSIDPPYLYLYQESKVTQKIKLSIPFLLEPGQSLKSWLRFPGIQEEAIPIELKILSPESERGKNQVVEVPLPVTLPFTGQEGWFSNALDRTTAGTFGLLSGVMELDKIPSRWLVAELLVILCRKGEQYTQTEPGRQLLNQLKHTRFFQNGVIAFTYAQIPSWLADSFKVAKTILGGQSLLYIWEQWLLSLVPAEEAQRVFVPPLWEEALVAGLEGAAERWFAGIVLGLALISPRVAIKLRDITSREVAVPKQILDSDRATQSTQSLLAGLPSLDTLPVRWLVVELLLLLCQQGDEYARTQAGSQLLAQLKCTRFFESGVLAFAAAQVPRWLVISQEAASAYLTSVGLQIGQGGLLYVGEQWLWSLLPTDLHLGQPTRNASVSGGAVGVIASGNMDAERWFSCVVLGLALRSPRIAATWCAIASSKDVDSLLPTPPGQTILNDVFQEGGSLQR